MKKRPGLSAGYNSRGGRLSRCRFAQVLVRVLVGALVLVVVPADAREKSGLATKRRQRKSQTTAKVVDGSRVQSGPAVTTPVAARSQSRTPQYTRRIRRAFGYQGLKLGMTQADAAKVRQVLSRGPEKGVERCRYETTGEEKSLKGFFVNDRLLLIDVIYRPGMSLPHNTVARKMRKKFGSKRRRDQVTLHGDLKDRTIFRRRGDVAVLLSSSFQRFGLRKGNNFQLTVFDDRAMTRIERRSKAKRRKDEQRKAKRLRF